MRRKMSWLAAVAGSALCLCTPASAEPPPAAKAQAQGDEDLGERALRGVETIRDMSGSKRADELKNYALSGEFGADLTRLAFEFAYADSWSQGTLTRRERSLVLIGALVALRQPNELKNHVKLGLANGIRPDELEPILIQLVPYVGFPATSTASGAMREAITEREKAGAPTE